MKLLRLLVLLFPVLANAESISVLGSGTVLVAITSAVDEFKKTTGMDVRLEPRESADGIFGIAEGKVDIGLTITAVTEAQKQLFPKVDFRSTTVGRGALYLLVSPDVWDAGVRALSREQVRDIVEKKTTHWKELGGPDLPIRFIAPGAGSATNFGVWLYGKSSPEFEAKVKTMHEGLSLDILKDLKAMRGGFAVLSERFGASKENVNKLAISLDAGVVEPGRENVSSGKYPLSFDLRLITNGAPSGSAKALVEFLLTEKAQGLIEAAGYARVTSHLK